MTYPYPQGGYNPQDPYNQGGGYPQSGGFPAQGGYPQTGGFPQQPGGYPQQPGGGYPPPGPPKKSNTALIVSIVAVVVLALGALGITGFVAPGFFLSGEKDDSGSGDGAGVGPHALAQQIVDGFNAKDTAKLQSLKCGSAEPDVDQVIAAAPQVSQSQLGQVRTVDETHATASVSVFVADVAGDTPVIASGGLVNEGGKWCWQTVDLNTELPGPPTGPSGGPSSIPPPITQSAPPIDPSGAPGAPGGGSGSSDLKSLMEEFLSKVNAGDVSGAQTVMCSDGQTSSVQEAVDKKVNLTLDSPPEDTGTFSIGDVSGSDGEGQRRIGSVDAERDDTTSPWCIEELRIY